MTVAKTGRSMKTGMTDDLRFIYALLLMRNGEMGKATHMMDSIADPKTRTFARESVEFAAGKGTDEPKWKNDEGSSFWEADIQSPIESSVIQQAYTEIAWGWSLRGENKKALECLRNVNIQDVGCRASIILGFYFSEEGELGARLAQTLFSQYCSLSNDEFLVHGPLFTMEERARAAKFLSKLKFTQLAERGGRSS